MSAILTCKDLDVRFTTEAGEVRAVNQLSFDLQAGECLGIVGESGSGKTQSFLAMLGLLAPNGRATGSVRFRDQEILNIPRRKLNELRGNRLTMVFQDALSSLTPSLRIGDQLIEGLVRHQGLSKPEARKQALAMLDIVKIPDAENRINAYPFELSGGMRQRVMIAMAMLCKPDVLIADEPTTALDVTVQAQILRLLDGLKRHTGTAVVMITHDLGVVAGLCDRVLIMYAGRPVEIGKTSDLFNKPKHPYTAGLLRSMPKLNGDPHIDLPAIAGQPPDLENLPQGCAFADRCQEVMDICWRERPELASRIGTHSWACHLDEPQ